MCRFAARRRGIDRRVEGQRPFARDLDETAIAACAAAAPRDAAVSPCRVVGPDDDLPPSPAILASARRLASRAR